MSKRPAMLASVIREIIAPVLRDCPQECGIVSLADVEVSGDFSYATAYITALQHPDVAVKYLEKRLPYLQKNMSAIHRAKVPRLRFRIDKRAEHGNRIDEILGDLSV